MKKLLTFLLLISCLAACKKDKSTGPDITALAKIFSNGKMTVEFSYSPKGKIERMNYYDEVTGLFDYASGFEYDANGNMITDNQYDQVNHLTGKVMYTYSADKRIIKQDFMPLTGIDSGKITVRVKYSYDPAGRITTMSWVDVVTDAIQTTRQLSYYDNNNLSSSAVYYHNMAPPELQWKTDYKPGSPVPGDLLKAGGYPINFMLYDMVTGQKNFYRYEDGITVDQESREIFSKREYDDQGYLLRQTVKQEFVKPAGFGTTTTMKYEYIKL